MDRDLVIRVFRSEVADSPGFVRSFEATAQRIAALHHPAIVPIHDYWREPGAAYLVMRRMHGGSLADRLERHDRGPLTVEEVTFIVRRVGAALVAATEAGLAHGRLDARTVLFDDAGEAWLSDFGLGDAEQEPAADVRALAALVRTCLPDATGGVAEVIEQGLSPAEGLSVDRYVPLLVAALTGGRVEGAPPAPNPYKGLRAFDEADAADFFGRTDLVDEVLERLRRDDLIGRLVLVVGGSGTGKSSVVRAGLLPRLRRGDVPGSDQWFVTTMLPGATPFKELAAALRRVAVTEVDGVADELATTGAIDAVVRRVLPEDGPLLLVIDQFEELFTSAPERDQRRFLGGLVEALTVPGSRLRVVGTLRADFYDRPLGVQPFGALVNDATVTIPAMSAAELEAAIVEPAHRVGRHVDRALVAELVNAAANQPAGLPALQFTLFELAERTEGDLTLAAYQDLGGLSGAIASRAGALYLSLEDEQRAAVRRLFQQLVVVHPDGEPTRRRASRAEVTDGDPALEMLVDRWAEARLLSLDRHRQSRLPTVELAHEALLREWPRLRRWIDEDRGVLLVLAQLREAAASWVEVGRDPSALYRGVRLHVALDHLRDTTVGVLEREFLDASTEARDAEERETVEQIERQARTNRRLRRQLVVIAGALVIALAGGFVAVDQRRDAQTGRRVAFARELAAAADANIEADPERSILLALAAIDETRHGDSALPEAIGALHEAISRSRAVLTVPGLGGDLDWSPDGTLFVTEGPEESGIIDLRDATTGESVRSWKGHDVDINHVAFSDDGSLLATTGDDGFLEVWDPATGEELGSYTAGAEPTVWGPAISPDGQLVAASWTDLETAFVRVFDRTTGAMLVEFERPTAVHLDFSPDGARLLVAADDEPGMVVIDPRTGATVLDFPGETGSVKNARYSPDGRWIASGHRDGSVRFWDAETGRRAFSVAVHESDVNGLDWSADSTRLATSSNDGTARVLEVGDDGARELLSVSARDTDGLAAVAFSPDGDRILTGDWGLSAAKIWDVSDQSGIEWLNAPSAGPAEGPNPFLPDNRTVLLVDPERGAAEWDAETGDPIRHLALPGPDEELWWLLKSPDGAQLLTMSERGLFLTDRVGGGPPVELESAPDGYPTAMAWSADGEHLVIAELRDPNGEAGGPWTQITVLDRDGRRVARFEDDGYVVKDVAFTADGTHLVGARLGSRHTVDNLGIRVWDWRTGEAVFEVKGLAIDVAVDPTSERFAFAQELNGEVEIWDLATRSMVRTIRGAGSVYAINWSLDGRRIAAAGADSTVRVFDADDGRLELILRGHERAVRAVAFNGDGTRLLSVDETGSARVWALDLDQLIGIARSRLTRSLDDAECRQYLHRTTCGDA